jgi:hypothetical protein
MSSQDKQEFDIQTLDQRLFLNKVDHLNYNPMLMEGSKRDTIIRILEKNSPKPRESLQGKVEQLYPHFNKSLNVMSQPEKDEYQRLSRLVKFDGRIPEFLNRELSMEGNACTSPKQEARL